MAFPTTSVIDNFNRADEGPPPSASWSANGPGGANVLKVTSNVCQPTDTGGTTGGCWGTTFGPDSECYMTLSTLNADGTDVRVLVRAVQTGAATVDGYAGRFIRTDSNPGVIVRLERLDNNLYTQLGASINDTAGALADGVKVGVDMVGSSVSAYINRGSWSTEGSRTDTTYTAAGSVGMTTGSSAVRYDDFGGGTIASGPTPLAPPVEMFFREAVFRAAVI